MTTNTQKIEEQLIMEAQKDPKIRQKILKELQDQLFEHKPATPHEFLTDFEYLGAAVHEVWPSVREDLTELLDGWLSGRYNEAIFCEGLGSGKSMKACLALAYIVHYLLCLRSPQSYFGLMPGSPLVIIVMSLRASQAKLISYDTMRSLIENSPWFTKYFRPDPRITLMMKFPKNIHVMSGNSRENFPIGYNLLASSLDEAAHFMDKSMQGDTEDPARNVYQVLSERSNSRFHGRGLTMMMSSPRSETDFIELKLQEDNPKIFKRRRSTWEAQPQSKYCGETFFFDIELMEISPNKRSSTVEVPVEFKPDFIRDPERSCRSFAAIPTRSISVFVRNRAPIDVFSDRKNPLTREGWLRDDFKPRPGSIYVMHVDLGVTDCAASFCMGHREKEKCFIDVVKFWLPSSVKDVDFGEIREFILALRDRGFDIALLTYDRFQSIDSRQQLEKHGIYTEEFSVERTLDPYNTWKEALYSDKIDIYDVPRYRAEATHVLLKNGRKIVKPSNGSKDVLDTVVAVTAKLQDYEAPILTGGLAI